MSNHSSRTLIFFIVLWFSYGSPASGQNKTDSLTAAHKMLYGPDSVIYRGQVLWAELDLMLNPIYISQFGSHYKLNGHRLNISPTPRFYAVQPGQLPLSNLEEILDQSNAAYLFFRLDYLNKSYSELLHNMRFVFGVTHDKLQTSSDSIKYKYDDGGTEMTFMLDRSFGHSLSDLDFKAAGLLFSFNVQAGFFLSVAKINTSMSWADTVISSVSQARWQLPSFPSGWGWLASSNVEIGGALCRHFGITVSAKLMGEGLYSADKVTVNNVGGYRLGVANYGIFFAGPIINLKWLNF